MFVDCADTLYASTSASSPSLPHSLVTIDRSSAAVTRVCEFTTQPSALVRVVALMSDGVAVHFVGTSTPSMQLLSLPVSSSASSSSPCSGTVVAAYPAAAAVFAGSPVLAAAAVPGRTSQVLVVAGFPAAKLFTVTSAGAVTLVSAHPVQLSGGHVISPYTIAYQQHSCAASASSAAPGASRSVVARVRSVRAFEPMCIACGISVICACVLPALLQQLECRHGACACSLRGSRKRWRLG
jgi:hypothetical protein